MEKRPISDVVGEVAIAITAMLRHFQTVADFLEILDFETCNQKRKRTIYLSTDSPVDYKEGLNRSSDDLQLISVTDMGDRMNRLNRFHHLL